MIVALFKDKHIQTHEHLFLKTFIDNYLGGHLLIKTWDQEIYSFYGLRFEPCDCSYDGHWRLTWSLTSGPMRLVEVHAS
jgi:hypothetical protein